MVSVKSWKLALPFLLMLLPVLLQPEASSTLLATSVHAQACTTVIEAPRLSPEPPQCGQPTRVTVRVIDACGAAGVELGFQGPLDGYFSWGTMSRVSGTRYDGHWSQTMWAFRGGGPLVYSIKVRRADGTDFVSNDHISSVAACNPITKVEVTPELVILDPGATQQFAAKALDASGYEIPNVAITWSVVQSGGAISSSGLFTAGAVLNTFTQTIRAAATTRDTVVTGFATVTVARKLKRVEVYPTNPMVPAGRSQQFTAKGFDSADQEISGLPFSWSVAKGGGVITVGGLFTAGNTQGAFPGTVVAEASRDGITVAGSTGVTVGAPCNSATPQASTYSGSIVTGFRAVPDGAKVMARVDDYASGSVTASGGRYKGLSVSPPCGSYIGRPVKFFVDGVETNEVALFQSGDLRSLDLTVGAGATIPLAKGWNLVSFPTPQDPGSVTSIFAEVIEATKVFTLDGERWLYATRSGGVWSGPLTEIEDGRGYWVFAEQASNVRLKPVPVSPAAPPRTYALLPGWNLVGFTSLEGTSRLSVADYFNGLGWQILYRYGQDAGYQEAKPGGVGFAEVEAGRGYYIFVQRTPYRYDDEFDGATLDSKWSWVNQDAAYWTIGAGRLRLRTQPGNIPSGRDGPARNILLQSLPTGDFEIATKLEFSPRDSFHQAGLVIYQDAGAFVKQVRLFAGGTQFVSFGAATTGWGDFRERTFAFTGAVSHLKIQKVGTVYKGSVSLDGLSWTLVTVYDVPDLEDYRVGLVAFNGLPSAAEINADFDYFHVYDRSQTWVVR